jgi:hypothetical protein
MAENPRLWSPKSDVLAALGPEISLSELCKIAAWQTFAAVTRNKKTAPPERMGPFSFGRRSIGFHSGWDKRALP